MCIAHFAVYSWRLVVDLIFNNIMNILCLLIIYHEKHDLNAYKYDMLDFASTFFNWYPKTVFKCRYDYIVSFK